MVINRDFNVSKAGCLIYGTQGKMKIWGPLFTSLIILRQGQQSIKASVGLFQAWVSDCTGCLSTNQLWMSAWVATYLPTIPWSPCDDGAGQLQEGQYVPGLWEASINPDKKVSSL